MTVDLAKLVKPLVWRKTTHTHNQKNPIMEWNNGFKCSQNELTYEIIKTFDTDSYAWELRGPDYNYLGCFDSPEAAQAAAQANYAASIIAALDGDVIARIRADAMNDLLNLVSHEHEAYISRAAILSLIDKEASHATQTFC